jgi:hypothetical protein
VIAKSLLSHPGQLLLNLDLNFIRIRLTEYKIQYDTGTDTDLFLYLCGIFNGHGVMLYQNLVDTGVTSDTFWEKRWRFVADMPVPVMAYALALYYDLIEKRDPVWKNDLPADLKNQLKVQ